MKYALVVVEKPIGRIAQLQGSWPGFLSRVASSQTTDEPTNRPAENCWLLSLENETQTLATVLSLAQDFEIPHRVLYFHDDPTEYSYKPPVK